MIHADADIAWPDDSAGAGPTQPLRDGLSAVVAEIGIDPSSTLAELASIERSCAWCFETHRVQLTGLLLTRDRTRAFFVFRAPDVESVRLACRILRVPLERVRLLDEADRT